MSWDAANKLLSFQSGGTKLNASGTADLQRALNTSRTSHYDIFQYASGVNPWSMPKAFINSTVVFDSYRATNSQRMAALRAANYGLEHLPVWTNRNLYYMIMYWIMGDAGTSLVNCPDFIRNNPSAWTTTTALAAKFYQYIHPSTWPANTPRRALDWDGYYGNAVAPITGYVFEGREAITGKLSGYCTTPANMLGYNLRLTDFTFGGNNAMDMYFGDIMKGNNGTYVAVNSDPVKNTGLRLYCADPGNLSGDYSHTPFLTTCRDSGWGPSVAAGSFVGTHVPLSMPTSSGERPPAPSPTPTPTTDPKRYWRYTRYNENSSSAYYGIDITGTYNAQLKPVVTAATIRLAMDLQAGYLPSGTMTITVQATMRGVYNGSTTGTRSGSASMTISASSYSQGGTAYIAIPISMSTSPLDVDSFSTIAFSIYISGDGSTPYYIQTDNYGNLPDIPVVTGSQSARFGNVANIQAAFGPSWETYMKIPADI